MPRVPFLDLTSQFASIETEILEAIQVVLTSQQFILGPVVERFEESLADLSRSEFAIGVSSGTDAILISLMAEGVGPGDEVITTAFSFFATAACVSRVGATPVFVDISPTTFNIAPAAIEAAITPRTRAIIPVHLFGHPADMDSIMAIANDHGLVVIEDAAQAIGSDFRSQPAGSIGHYGCFSFFPSKNLGGMGDGGMVVTNDPQRAETLRILRGHGGSPKYYHKLIGGNFRLDALQAAILSVKLGHLESWTAQRRRNADRYRQLFRAKALDPESLPACLLGDCGNPTTCSLTAQCAVVVPEEAPSCHHVYNQFVIRTPQRDQLRSFLREKDIATEIYYPVPFHLQECYEDLGYDEGAFPASECAAGQVLALPIFPELTDSQITRVVDSIEQFFLKQRRSPKVPDL